jgi:quercetin dioxygenase-like cupin family protein
MRLLPLIGIAASSLLLASPALLAQSPEQVTKSQEQLMNSGPSTTSIPMPDATHIPIVFGKDIKWKGDPAKEQTAALFGAEDQPGIYGILIKWNPGANSQPHFHSTVRYIYVVSGTWWVSSSNTYDKSKMYPVPAGSFVTDVPKTVHWDGAKAETGSCILLLVGVGPMVTTRLTQKDPSSNVYSLPSK